MRTRTNWDESGALPPGGTAEFASKRAFQVGDKVTVTGMRKVTYPPGMKDELGTEKLFRRMLGKVYTVRGLDNYGNVELEPKRRNTVWIEPEFVKLRARKPKRRR